MTPTRKRAGGRSWRGLVGICGDAKLFVLRVIQLPVKVCPYLRTYIPVTKKSASIIMNLLKLPIVLAVTLVASACVPEPGTAEYNAYQQHKANREAVMYQGY